MAKNGLPFGKQSFQVHGTVMFAYSKPSSKDPSKLYHNVRLGVTGSGYDVHFRAANGDLVEALAPYEGQNVILVGEAVAEQGQNGGRPSIQIGGQISAYLVKEDGTTSSLYTAVDDGRRRAA